MTLAATLPPSPTLPHRSKTRDKRAVEPYKGPRAMA